MGSEEEEEEDLACLDFFLDLEEEVVDVVLPVPDRDFWALASDS